MNHPSQACFVPTRRPKRSASLRLASLIGLAASLFLAAAHAEAEWKAVRCIPADAALEDLFDTVSTIENFEVNPIPLTAASGGQQAGATVARDTTVKHAGAAALRVDYAFAADKELEYIQLVGAAAVFTNKSQSVGFWYKNTGVPLPMKLRLLDASGECHQMDFVSTPSQDWQFVVCKLDGGSAAWGGDGNKRMDFPCRFDSICLDRPKVGYKGKGSFWIDDLAILKPAPARARPLSVETDAWRHGNLYRVGNTINLKAHGEGGRIRWSARDFFGKVFQKGEGPATGTEIHFLLTQSGWFSCRLELLAQNKVQGSESFCVAALPGGVETARSDFFGVCTHFGQSSYSMEAMELLQHYGIDQFRDEISWGSVESTKGKYSMPDYGVNYLKKAVELKMRPLLIYDYANHLYDNGAFPNSPESIAAFARYAVELTRATRGQVSSFEVWNEWIGGCGMEGRPGKHDGEAYGRLLQPVYAAVKKEFPEVTVVGIGGEYGDACISNIQAAIRVAGTRSMDAWSIHPYRYPHAPEASDLLGEIGRIREGVSKTGEPGKAWITEIGWPTHRGNGGSDEAAQARFLVRTLALVQASQSAEKLFWYDFKDDGLNREYNECNFGLIHHETYNCAPKPGIVAASIYIRLTGSGRFARLQQRGGVNVAFINKANGDDVLIVWRETGAGRVTLTGSVSAGFDLMGAPIPVQNQSLAIDENPVYVVGKNLTVSE